MKEKLLLFRRPSSSVIVSALGAVALAALPGQAGTITYGGSGTLSGNGNWVGGSRPGTADEALFTGTPPAAISTASGTALEFGDFLWNSNGSSVISLNTSGNGSTTQLRISGGGGSTAALSNGGGTGDIILLGTDATSNTVQISPNAGSGTNVLQIRLLSSGNFNVVNSGATLDIESRITDNNEGYTTTKTGDGTVVLRGSNTFSNFTLQAGTLAIRNSTALGTAPLTINGGVLAAAVVPRTLTNNIAVGGDFTLGGLTQSIALNGTVNLGGATRTVTLANSADLGGEISNGGLTVAGGSTLNLTAANNTYAGATLVSSGTLLINGALANSASVTADGGATVGGDGSIANALTLASGSALRPGASTGDAVVGSLDTGNLTMAGAYFATITANGVNDFLNITGNADFTGGTIAPFLSSYAPVLGDAFNLADWTGSSTGVPTFDYNFAVLDPGLKWDDSSFVSDGFLRVAAVPEPSAALLGSLGCLLFFRRRKS